MKWFEGSINEAVATSKSKKAIFVVFVEGKDDISTQVAHAINSVEVSTRLEQTDFVAIRIESGSETCRFFAQIYQLVPVPSLFFIGENGAPLEIVAGNTTGSELVTKIDLVLTKAGKNIKSSSTHLIEAEQISASASKNSTCSDNVETSKVADNASALPVSSIESSAVEKTLIAVNTNAIAGASNTENETPTDAQKDNATVADNVAQPDSQNNELTMKEKVDRAMRKLIELQEKERIEEERGEKERELERRRVGRDMQKLKQKQQEMEIKQAHEERIREKAAETAAREKVRQQIAQDKLERKQKELALQQQVQKQPEAPEPRRVLPGDSTITRIQFRLPSGTPHMGQFQPTTTLGVLRTYVIENIDLPFRQFVMSTSFPRRDLTNEDDKKTLLDLELVPTAVILILPLKNAGTGTTVTSTQDIGFISRLMWTLFAPLWGVYEYLMGYFSGTSQRRTDRRRDSVGATGTTNRSDRTATSHLQNAGQSGLFRRNLNTHSGTTIRAQGNIHRLHSAGDDNDENNTWNGNSTQQM